MTNQYFLTFGVPAWWTLLVVLAAVLIAFFYYRKTNPPISSGKKRFLMLLRTSALMLVALAFLKPQWLILHQKQIPPVVATLLDNSASMKIPDNNGSRGDSLRWFLSEFRKLPQSDSLERRLYIFSDSVSLLRGDSLTFKGVQSDLFYAINTVLDSLQDRNLQGLYLFSDGRATRGEDPTGLAAKSTVPIHTILVGSPSPVPDLKIASVTSPRVVSQGDTLPILVKVVNRGLEGQVATIRIEGAGGKRLIKKIKLARGGFEQEIRFDYVAVQPGNHLLRAVSSVAQNELNRENNQSHFYLRVLKKQQRVLLISGRANFDQQALTFALNKIPKIVFRHVTETGVGKFVPEDWSSHLKDSLDAVLLLGFPTTKTPQNIWQNLAQKINSEQIPVWVFLNRYTDVNRLNQFKDRLPGALQPLPAARREGEVQLTYEGEWHPATRLAEDQTELMALWKSLPPVEMTGFQVKPQTGAASLLSWYATRSAKTYPVYLALKKGYSKTLLFAAADFYRWHLPLQMVAGKQMFFQKWVTQSLRWLMNREDLNPVQIFPERRVYAAGEDIVFSGNVLDDFYRARHDAEVRFEILDGTQKITDVFRHEAGRYRFVWHSPPPGEYRYRISARIGEREMGAYSGKLFITETNPEQANPDTDPELLKEIAQKSGGDFLTVKQALEQIKQAKFSAKNRQWEENIPLWYHPVLLVVIIFLLAVEWFFRKRWGLL